MTVKSEDIISQSIESLEENERIIQEHKEKYAKLIHQKEEKFLELAEKVRPLIKHAKSKGYDFYNKEFDCHSFLGPVVGLRDNVMFVYEGEGHVVTKYDLFSNQEDHTLLENFLSEHSFKSAMDGLLEVTNVQSKRIGDYKAEIRTAELELKQY